MAAGRSSTPPRVAEISGSACRGHDRRRRHSGRRRVTAGRRGWRYRGPARSAEAGSRHRAPYSHPGGDCASRTHDVAGTLLCCPGRYPETATTRTRRGGNSAQSDPGTVRAREPDPPRHHLRAPEERPRSTRPSRPGRRTKRARGRPARVNEGGTAARRVSSLEPTDSRELRLCPGTSRYRPTSTSPRSITTSSTGGARERSSGAVSSRPRTVRPGRSTRGRRRPTACRAPITSRRASSRTCSPASRP